MDWLDLLAAKGLSRVFSNTTIQKHQFFGTQLSLQSNSHPYMTTGKTIVLTRWTFAGKVMSLLFNMVYRLVITFLPRSKRLLISRLQSPSAVILEPKKQHNFKERFTQRRKERQQFIYKRQLQLIWRWRYRSSKNHWHTSKHSTDVWRMGIDTSCREKI